MKISIILNDILIQYKSSKKFDEEKRLFCFKLYRPISFYLSAILIFFKIKPNKITFVNFVFMITSFIFFLKGAMFLGAFFLLMTFILDLSDGNMARYYNTNNSFGKLADGLVDSLIFITFFSYSVSLVINDRFIINEKITLIIGAVTSLSMLFKTSFDLRCNWVLLRDEKRNEIKNVKKNFLHKDYNFFSFCKNLVNEIYLALPIILILSIYLDYPEISLIFYFFVIFFISNFEILLKLYLIWKKFNK